MFSLGEPLSHCVDQAGHKLGDPSAFASLLLVLWECLTTPGSFICLSLCVCLLVCMYTICMQYPQRPEERASDFSGTGRTGGPPSVCFGTRIQVLCKSSK